MITGSTLHTPETNLKRATDSTNTVNGRGRDPGPNLLKHCAYNANYKKYNMPAGDGLRSGRCARAARDMQRGVHEEVELEFTGPRRTAAREKSNLVSKTRRPDHAWYSSARPCISRSFSCSSCHRRNLSSSCEKSLQQPQQPSIQHDSMMHTSRSARKQMKPMASRPSTTTGRAVRTRC
jgi:hypothetical protein